MTNWETFVVVAIPMALLFAPFIAMIVAGLRHSKETYQILYKANSFNNPWPQYFISLDIIFASSFIFMGFFMAKTTYAIRNNSSSILSWAGYFLLWLLVLSMFILAAYILVLTINHWKYTKDVIITFDPENKIIFVENSLDKYELREDDIESADVFSNEKRVLFQFYRLKIRDKPDLILTGNTRGVSGIFEFFKKIPVQHHREQFPIIR